VLIHRVVTAIDRHKIVDLSQYGAIPKAGTYSPLRVITEAIDDARTHGNELHILALDLKKSI